jgi:WhiB family redox-sensing transcriptional regulator
MTHDTGGSWRSNAACHGQDPELFFASERDPEVGQARIICGRCPSRAGCLTDSYTDGDIWGIRGGLSYRQRQYFLRRNDGNIPRAVAEATGDVTVLLRHIYEQHAQPSEDGHVVWTDTRHYISVQRKAYTVLQLAFLVVHGRVSHGQVKRLCDVEGCVAAGCLADRVMREQAKAAV